MPKQSGVRSRTLRYRSRGTMPLSIQKVMIVNHSEPARHLIRKRCEAAPDGQFAVSVEDLCVLVGTSPAQQTQMCDLLLDMRSRGEIELSIWHPVAFPESDLAGYPHCVPYDQWTEWGPYEFFQFGVRDHGRIRINAGRETASPPALPIPSPTAVPSFLARGSPPS